MAAWNPSVTFTGIMERNGRYRGWKVQEQNLQIKGGKLYDHQ